MSGHDTLARPARAALAHRVAARGRELAQRADALLTPRRLRLYAAAFATVTLLVYVAAGLAGHAPFDVFGHPLFPDFSAQATAGRIALAGNMTRLYDTAHQHAVQQALLGAPPHDPNLFMSPPFVAYLWAPFAALPYLAGAGAWTVVSLALLVVSLHLLWPRLPRLHQGGFALALLLVCSSQPVAELLLDGQDAALALFLIVVALRLLLAGRDTAAGALLGLGVFKPQLFLLMPVLLLCLGRRRAAAAWVLTAAALTALSLTLVGPAGVRAYLAILSSPAYHQALQASLGAKMQSATALLRPFVPARATLYVSAGAMALGALLVAWAARRYARPARGERTFTLLYAFTLLVTGLVSPHFFIYDCAILLPAALLLLNEAPSSPRIRLALAAAYLATWTTALRYALFGRAPEPLALVLAGPWIIVSLVLLAQRALRLLAHA